MSDEFPAPTYKKGGKPRRQFTEADLKQIRTMAGLGMPARQMAAILNMSHDWFMHLVKKDDTARQNIEEGRAISSINVRKSAYEMAQTDPVMMKFWLKTREGFRETDRLEVTGADGKPLELSCEQRKTRFAKIRKAMAITEREAKKYGEDTE